MSALRKSLVMLAPIAALAGAVACAEPNRTQPMAPVQTTQTMGADIAPRSEEATSLAMPPEPALRPDAGGASP